MTLRDELVALRDAVREQSNLKDHYQEWDGVEERFAALLAAHEDDAADARRWRDIETAPRDGTVVMFHVPSKVTPAICRADDFWYGRNHAEDRGFAYWLDGATHWMPLPTPPAAIQQEADDGK